MQPDNTTSYFSTPDEHYWNTPDTARSEVVIVEMQPPADAFPNKGRFKKGFDARRHKFTKEECSRGFWAAIAIYGVGIGRKLHAAGRWPGYRGARKPAASEVF